MNMTDRERFLETAKSYIGKNGKFVCLEKLKIGFICDWCAFAVSSIMNDCGFIGKYIKAIEGGAGTIPRYSDSKYGDWFPKGTKSPQAGDLFFLRYNDYPYQDKYFCDHIGIVESVNGNIITTLEGNVDGIYGNWAVTSTFKRKVRYLNNATVYAFYRPYWWDEKTTSTSGSTSDKKSVDEIADEVIVGKWGSGEDRKKKLTASGYDFSTVQSRVNAKLSETQKQLKSVDEIAKEVIAGKWNSGSEREKLLKAAGYDYTAVQSKVNTLLSRKTVDDIALEVINGKWGSGEERKKKLTAAGYDYKVIQKRVNDLLK